MWDGVYEVRFVGWGEGVGLCLWGGYLRVGLSLSDGVIRVGERVGFYGWGGGWVCGWVFWGGVCGIGFCEGGFVG